MHLLNNLQWRYATKQFDPTKKIPDAALKSILEAVQLSASSFGLQLYKVISVEDKEVRKRLRAASWDQSQITDASHLIVFCNYSEVSDKHIDEYFELKSEYHGIQQSDLKGYSDFIKANVSSKSLEERNIWTAKQTYLALGNLLNACAELKIDSCPMEGFDSFAYNDVLGIKEEGLNAAVIATIGYRSNEDTSQNLPKIRKPLNRLFQVI